MDLDLDSAVAAPPRRPAAVVAADVAAVVAVVAVEDDCAITGVKASLMGADCMGVGVVED